MEKKSQVKVQSIITRVSKPLRFYIVDLIPVWTTKNIYPGAPTQKQNILGPI